MLGFAMVETTHSFAVLKSLVNGSDAIKIREDKISERGAGESRQSQ
jgi:hypothetical protein